MTNNGRSLPVLIHPKVHSQNNFRTPHRWLIALIGSVLFYGFVSLFASLATAEELSSPMLLADVVAQQAEKLAVIDSDEKAMALFTSTVGPALGLRDAAGALGAKRLPSKIVKDLQLPDLSESVFQLMGALAVWQFADAVDHGAGQSSTDATLSETRQGWLRARGQSASLSDLFSLAQEPQTVGNSEIPSDQQHTKLLLIAQRTAFQASRQATKAWWDVYGWKDRVRQTKGLARLCGTWQWTIHNHQNHGEQKAVVIFPRVGQTSAHAATPAEIIILGDAIYLRWENNGHIQEDSLLFIKDDAKIEGSFVNNTGGWGPITGKRTAPCQP